MRKIISLFSRISEIAQFDNWLQLLTERVFFRKTTVQVHRAGSLQMLVDHRAADAGSIRACIATPMYRQFLEGLTLEKKISVLDIGANVGGFSLLLSHLGYELSTLLCLELNPLTYERLRFNIKTNLGIDTHVKNIGVWYDKGKVNVRMGIGSTGDSITPKKGIDYEGLPEHTVPTDTINNLIEKYFGADIVDICKIDIEGAESDVFLEAPENCSRLRQVRYLIIEIHHLKTYQKVLNQLDLLGFELIDQNPDSTNGLGVHVFQNNL